MKIILPRAEIEALKKGEIFSVHLGEIEIVASEDVAFGTQCVVFPVVSAAIEKNSKAEFRTLLAMFKSAPSMSATDEAELEAARVAQMAKPAEQ